MIPVSKTVQLLGLAVEYINIFFYKFPHTVTAKVP